MQSSQHEVKKERDTKKRIRRKQEGNERGRGAMYRLIMETWKVLRTPSERQNGEYRKCQKARGTRQSLVCMFPGFICHPFLPHRQMFAPVYVQE